MSSSTIPPHGRAASQQPAAEACAEVHAPVPVERSTPHPKVAALERVVEKVGARAPPEPPGIIGYLSEVVGRDFLDYAPPEMKAFTLAAIKDARLGKWKKMRALSALLTPGNPLSKAAWKRALAEALGHLTYEVPPLSTGELASLRTLLEGPVADVIRAQAAGGKQAPHDLKSLDELLSSKALRARLLELHPVKEDVEAAIKVARAVVDQLSEHFEAFAIDRQVLEQVTDASGRLDSAKLDRFPPIVRVLLEDPQCGARTISAVRKGAVVTTQLLRKTPEKVIADLNKFSATLAGGGSLWVDEYVRTGRKLRITRGDVERKRLELEKTVGRVEAAIEKCRDRLLESKKVEPAQKQALTQAIAIADPEARARALDTLVPTLDGAAKGEAIRFARLTRNLEVVRATDPKAVLEEIQGQLSRFEAFRKEAVRISVGGAGSAEQHGLAGAIQRSRSLGRYGHETLVETVSHDYANEATESARKIIYGVGGMAVAGVGAHELFGDGVMHTLISIFEDVATDVGEVSSMTSQGVPLGDIVRGGRVLGQLLTLGGATFAASQAHHFIAAGASGATAAGTFGGFLLGVGSCALTCYTSVYSYNLFRRVFRDLALEGKFDLASTRAIRKALPDEARSALEAAEHQLGRLPTPDELVGRLKDVSEGRAAELGDRYAKLLLEHGEDAMVDEARRCLPRVAEQAGMPELVEDLESAFDRVRSEYQGLPDGDSLARALAELRTDLPESVLSAVRETQQDAIRLVAHGVDQKAVLHELAVNLAHTLTETVKHKGHSVDESAVLALLAQRLSALETSFDLGSAQLVGLIDGCMRDVVELAAERDPQARALLSEISTWRATLQTHAKDLDREIEQKVRTEIRDFGRRAGRDQTIANPVRAMLILGIAVCVVSLTTVGALLPAFLLGKVGAGVLATLASSESLVATFGLASRKHVHQKALRQLGEAIAGDVRRERLGPELGEGAPAGAH